MQIILATTLPNSSYNGLFAGDIKGCLHFESVRRDTILLVPKTTWYHVCVVDPAVSTRVLEHDLPPSESGRKRSVTKQVSNQAGQ